MCFFLQWKFTAEVIDQINNNKKKPKQTQKDALSRSLTHLC